MTLTELLQHTYLAFTPPKKQTVSEWADDNRVLVTESSAESGPWRTNRRPYLQAPMDAFTQPGIWKIVLMASSQYTAHAVTKLTTDYGWQQSFSRVCQPGDNAWSESFFSILKKEIIHWHHYPTREMARQKVIEYIEIYYNRQRKQKRLCYLSPIQFLNHWMDQTLICVA